MKQKTIVDIFESYLNIDTYSADQLSYELSDEYIDNLFYKVPLGQLKDYIEVVEQMDFFDRFGSIQEYKEFKDSCVESKVIELDSGLIVIVLQIGGIVI